MVPGRFGRVFSSSCRICFYRRKQMGEVGLDIPSHGRRMIEMDIRRLEELILRPSESLAVEVKRWIDPATPEGTAKIVRAVFALRNHGGGYFIVGFEDDTLHPDQTNIPPDVHSAFHTDNVQRLITKYASEPFEVAIAFPVRNGQEYPVIVVPSGVKTPVAVKADLVAPNATSTKLLGIDDVYVRTLRSNNTPSTAKAGWKDWPALMDICFDNREADIGRFLRRHLSGLTPELIRQLGSAFQEASQPTPTTADVLGNILKQGEARFEAVKTERSLILPPHGSYEIALLINGEFTPSKPTNEFLNLLDASNPDLTGWPVWLDSRNFVDASTHPYIAEKAWEAIIVSLKSGWGFQHIDFMRLDPTGKFYLRRALADDLKKMQPPIEPLTLLDFGLVILRTAEAIAVGLAFAKAMGLPPEQSTLSYAFRWTGLKGRLLASWASPERDIANYVPAHDDTALSIVDVSVDTPYSAISPFVSKAVGPLFEIFGGLVVSDSVIEDLTRRLVERRL